MHDLIARSNICQIITGRNMARAKTSDNLRLKHGTGAKMTICNMVEPSGTTSEVHWIPSNAYDDVLSSGVLQQLISGPLYETFGLFSKEGLHPIKPLDLINGSFSKDKYRKLKMFIVEDALVRPPGTFEQNDIASDASTSFQITEGRPMGWCLEQPRLLGSVLVETSEIWSCAQITGPALEKCLDEAEELLHSEKRVACFYNKNHVTFYYPNPEFVSKVKLIVKNHA